MRKGKKKERKKERKKEKTNLEDNAFFAKEKLSETKTLGKNLFKEKEVVNKWIRKVGKKITLNVLYANYSITWWISWTVFECVILQI